MSVILLADNGSRKAEATLQLRYLANDLGKSAGLSVHPVSLMHANRIPDQELDGLPAQVFYDFMRQQLSEGQKEFILIPLFFGKSRALTKFIPEQIILLENKYGTFKFKMCNTVYPLPTGEPILTHIVIDHIKTTISENRLPLDNIVLVDHGSPVPCVTDVRKHLVDSVQRNLGEEILLEQAVMERRSGIEYDFNGGLLEDYLLSKARAGETSAVVVLLFFLPGRHAGKGGDIEKICQNVMQQHSSFKIAISPLISEHNLFTDILRSRLEHEKGSPLTE